MNKKYVHKKIATYTLPLFESLEIFAVFRQLLSQTTFDGEASVLEL